MVRFKDFKDIIIFKNAFINAIKKIKGYLIIIKINKTFKIYQFYKALKLLKINYYKLYYNITDLFIILNSYNNPILKVKFSDFVNNLVINFDNLINYKWKTGPKVFIVFFIYKTPS